MNSVSVEAYLKDLSQNRHDQFIIIDRLRKIVLATGPNIIEEVKYNGVLFSSHVNFCGIFPYTAHLALEFSEGAKLPDTHGVLVGGGKHRRHIKIMTMKEVEVKHIEHYVGLAYKATFECFGTDVRPSPSSPKMNI